MLDKGSYQVARWFSASERDARLVDLRDTYRSMSIRCDGVRESFLKAMPCFMMMQEACFRADRSREESEKS